MTSYGLTISSVHMRPSAAVTIGRYVPVGPVCLNATPPARFPSVPNGVYVAAELL